MLRKTLLKDARHLEADLDAVASQLRRMWSSALIAGDFQTIDRLVEASHAVHRAVVALQSDSLVPSGGLTADPAVVCVADGLSHALQQVPQAVS